MCKRFMVVILVLGVLFAPGLAFADGFGGSDGGDFSDRVIYGPNVLDIQNGTYGVQVYAGNKFNAALCALGYDGYDSRFTSDVKAYLSNETTGGSFYEFCQLFTNNNDPNYQGFTVGGITYTSAISTNNLLYGSQFVFAAIYSDALRAAAYARVEEVLDGNISGGSGGGSGGGTVPKTFTMEPIAYSANVTAEQTQYNSNINYVITLSDRAKQLCDSYISEYPYFMAYTNSYRNYANQASARVDIWIVLSKTPYVYSVDVNNVDVPLECRFYHKAYTDLTYSGGNFVYDGYDFTSMSTGTSFKINLGSNTGNVLRMYNTATSAPVVPPTQWPEPDPVTPTEPPEVPEPPEPTTPTEPTITAPTIPTLPPLTYPTEPTYATPDIAAILDAMAKHCKHLQECMKNVSDDYYDSMTSYMLTLQNKDFEFLRSWFRVTLDTIRDCFDDLSDYLQTLFTWLADQMDFTFTGGDFDDSSIVWWLKQIYSKLGSGTTVRPTDPVVDPTGAGDWLDQLLKNFVLDLLALGQDALADVAEMFRQLITKFPFSIPWDIAAMLALFSASPQIPVIQIPQYALTGSGISQVGTYTIDLTPYDGAMGIARSVENVVFAFWLAWKIDFFKAILTGVLGGDK